MLVPLSWLKAYVEIDVPVEWLAERLTLAGLEVASIRYIGVPQHTVEGIRQPKSDHLVWDREKLLLGAIREVKKHPDADKLVLAMVDYGAAELEQCVTGAPNLFEYAGQGALSTPLWTGFALEGATVWDGHSDEPKLMTLKGKNLRGIFNKSMVCSEKELGISDEHEGVILLDHDDRYVAGTPLQDVLGDVVLEVEFTPNQGHCMSILGVAREVAAILGKDVQSPSTEVVATGAPIAGQIAIEIRDPQMNPRFVAALLRDTAIKPSPTWLQWRLKLVGQRPINNIVDITNYIMFETGQPLHAFDYDKLVARANGKTPTIITRLSQQGEILETLDGMKRTLNDQTVLVTDTAGILALAGIMGGAETEISETTTNVLLEAASWHFITLRRTTQTQKLYTEASGRFTRNIHPSRTMIGCLRGIELMRQLGGGTIAQGVVDQYPQVAATIHVALPIAVLRRKLGMEVSLQQAADILSRLLFDVTIEDEKLRVTAPDYRTDISEGIIGQADLVEEIARIIGYDKIPNTMIADAMPPQRSDRRFELEEHLRDLLTALGLTENIGYRLTTPETEALLTPPDRTSSLPQADYVVLMNPISEDKRVMRHTLMVSLLQNAERNARYQVRQGLFEIGSVYLKKADEPLPDEPLRVAMLLTGQRHDADWTQTESPTMSFFDLKGVIEALLQRLHIVTASYTRSQHSTFHPGRSASVWVNGVKLGDFGELHPLVAQHFKQIETPILLAEFDLEALIQAVPTRFVIKPLPITPPILEDIALVVAESVSAAEVEVVIRKGGGDLLTDVRLFDVYRGESIGAGQKSLAYALTYQTDAKTLNDKEVEKLRKKIIALAERELNAKLRS